MNKADIPEEHNYETTDKCDSCSKHAHGTMLHANSASGMATPVLFLCDRCHKPNWIQKRYDSVVRLGTRLKWKYRFYANNTRAERAALRVKAAERRARWEEMKAERAAREAQGAQS